MSTTASHGNVVDRFGAGYDTTVWNAAVIDLERWGHREF